MKYIKTPARQAVEKAIRWQVPFTVLDIQQFSALDEQHTRQYLATLVKRDVLVCRDAVYTAGPASEEWMRTPPKTRPGGNDPLYRQRQAVLDRWRQAAWQQGRDVDGIEAKSRAATRSARVTRAPIAYTVAETAVFFGVTVRCVHQWIKRGTLKASNAIGQLMITHAEIIRVLEGRKEA